MQNLYGFASSEKLGALQYLSKMPEANTEMNDDDLKVFEASGAAPLPTAAEEGYIDHDGARIWYVA